MSRMAVGSGMSRAAVIAGIGAYVPPRVVTNDDLAQRLETSDEWIRTRTGIVTRHIVDEGMATVDLGTEAGREALKSAGESQVDAVVVATTTPDRRCPASAPEIASRLGLSGVAAFDVGAVCTGFVYALAVSAGLISAGIAEWVLCVGAEAFSNLVDPRDRTTAVIFGDGAGAVVLRAGDPDELGAVGPFDLGSDGDRSDLIAVAAGGSRQPLTSKHQTEDLYLAMDGREVYRHAIPRMAESSKAVLERAGLQVADVDRFVGHQANIRILDAVADRLGIPADRRVANIERVGNTAGASIPLALADAAADGTLQAGHRVLLTAFGGGLTWGSTVLTWPMITIG
ncbi:MAG: beta-ketoacyl-ACP synthase III [Egibacteraceae bacterium]